MHKSPRNIEDDRRTYFYATNLSKLGHEAWDIEANNEPLQRAWARENGAGISQIGQWKPRLKRGFVPWISRVDDQRWMYEVLAAQIKQYRPDVLVNYTMQLDTQFFREIKGYIGFLVGHHAAPLPAGRDFEVYDLTLSLVNNFVDYFRRQGMKSELLRLGFEPSVLGRLGKEEPSIAVSFVGNLFTHHASRIEWLEYLCQRVPVQVWTGSNGLSSASSIMNCRRGTVWGLDMYQVLHQSKLSLNHHIDVAENYAGNIRLFESTGVGSLLVTDWKPNLHEIFEPGKEVIAYRSHQECVEMIEYYLSHEHERQSIARAGQERTLTEHTYYHRMQELIGILSKHMTQTYRCVN